MNYRLTLPLARELRRIFRKSRVSRTRRFLLPKMGV